MRVGQLWVAGSVPLPTITIYLRKGLERLKAVCDPAETGGVSGAAG